MSKNKLAGIIAACTIVIIIAVVLVSVRPWEATPSTQTHTLTTLVNPSGAGSISPSSGDYESGLQVTLTASPASGYTFDYWSGDVSTVADVNSASTTITVDDNYSVTANFEPAPTELSSTEAQQLTGYLEEISDGWDQPSVDAANAILSNESLGPEAWESFFEEYFSRHHFADDLRNYLNYPVYWWFSDTVHANLQQGLYSSLTGIINGESSTYIGNDRSSLTRDSNIVQSIMNAHRFLSDMIRLQAPGVEYRDDIFEFYEDLVKDNEIIYGTALLDVDEYPFAGAFRAQAHMNLVDALDLSDPVRNQIIDILELTGMKRDILYDHGALVIDNQGLGTRQLEVIKSILNLVPSEMYNLTNITVNDFLGNSGDRYLWFLSKAGVNIFGNEVGTANENSFPSDVSPSYTDGFSIVVAHELNHRVNADYIEESDMLSERQETLIEQAGLDSMNYLRSMFDDDFFQKYPQEFFASISNQWFNNSERTLSLGIERFSQGRPGPLNQFLFCADVYSRGGSSTLFYTLDTNGNLTREEIPIVRDGNGHIVELYVGSEHYSFQLDGDGNVVSVIVP